MHHRLRLNLKRPHQVMRATLERTPAPSNFPDRPDAGSDKHAAPAPAQTHSSGARPRPAAAALPIGSANAQRHKPPRPPDQLRRTIHHRHHRIVAPLQNLPVMHQERIRNPSQPRPRFIVINRNRLFAQVCAESSPAPAPARPQTANAATAHKAKTRPATESPAQHASAIPLPSRFRASTIGRAAVISSASSSAVSAQTARAASKSFTITASGFP